MDFNDDELIHIRGTYSDIANEIDFEEQPDTYKYIVNNIIYTCEEELQRRMEE